MDNHIGIAVLPKLRAAVVRDGQCRRIDIFPEDAKQEPLIEGLGTADVKRIVCACRDGDEIHIGLPNLSAVFPSAEITFRNHSEAAAAWYCHEVKQKNGESFRGTLLICSADAHGVEAAVCKIGDREEIEPVAIGLRVDYSHVGAAVCDAAGIGISNADGVLDQLTANLSSFNNSITMYEKSGARTDMPVFSYMGRVIFCSQALSGFAEAKHATEKLLEKIDEALDGCRAAGTDFPVLFTDRIVSLAPIGDTIRRHFSGWAYKIDRRYAVCLNEAERDDTAAYGAALLAANEVSPQATLDDDCFLLTEDAPLLLGAKGTRCEKHFTGGVFAADAVFAVVGESFTVRIGGNSYLLQIPEFPAYPNNTGALFSFGLRWKENQLFIAVKPTEKPDNTEQTVILK